MAELTIDLRTNPTTGKKDITISLKSDKDKLPFEHEQEHRNLVNKLIEGGVVKAEELGKVVVTREEEESVVMEEQEKQTEREAVRQGN